jgi:hypothetical protein
MTFEIGFTRPFGIAATTVFDERWFPPPVITAFCVVADLGCVTTSIWRPVIECTLKKPELDCVSWRNSDWQVCPNSNLGTCASVDWHELTNAYEQYGIRRGDIVCIKTAAGFEYGAVFWAAGRKSKTGPRVGVNTIEGPTAWGYPRFVAEVTDEPCECEHVKRICEDMPCDGTRAIAKTLLVWGPLRTTQAGISVPWSVPSSVASLLGEMFIAGFVDKVDDKWCATEKLRRVWVDCPASAIQARARAFTLSRKSTKG